MQCYGGGIPTGANSSDLTVAWKDATNSVQTAPNLQYSSLTLSASPATTAMISVNVKRVSTAGMKAMYSFQVSSPVALTASAMFYFDFHAHPSKK